MDILQASVGGINPVTFIERSSTMPYKIVAPKDKKKDHLIFLKIIVKVMRMSACKTYSATAKLNQLKNCDINLCNM